jgi:hypothetical protein
MIDLKINIIDGGEKKDGLILVPLVIFFQTVLYGARGKVAYWMISREQKKKKKKSEEIVERGRKEGGAPPALNAMGGLFSRRIIGSVGLCKDKTRNDCSFWRYTKD